MEEIIHSKKKMEEIIHNVMNNNLTLHSGEHNNIIRKVRFYDDYLTHTSLVLRHCRSGRRKNIDGLSRRFIGLS